MEHIEHLLQAYHDGELPPRRRRQVEAHLERCAACRAELAGLEQLSSALDAFALPDTFASDETFRAQVMLRLSRRPARALGANWWLYLVPVSLLCAAAALVGLWMVTDLVRVVQPLLAWVGVDPAALLQLPSVLQLAPEFGTWVAAVSGPLWSIALYLGLLLVFGSYVGWVGVLWRAESQPVSRKEG